MTKNWFKQIQQQKILVRAAFLLLFFALSACEDSGCIDADDFGEYESQTITVSANAQQSNCTYDSTLDITDADQGSGIKSCLVSGTTTVYDETGTAYSSTDGCQGFEDDATLLNLCIADCVQNCLANSGSSSSGSEPYWTSTDKRSSGANSGVTLYPGSQIIIRAIGTVYLGDSLDYTPIYVQAVNSLPHSKSSSWGSLFFDARSGQTLNVNFSGKWSDGTNTVGSGTSSTIDATTYNGARRLIAYLVPHPDGYSFDTSATTEYAGTKGVPLLPDPLAWTCDYTGSGSSLTAMTESNCYNKASAYTSLGYSNADDSLSVSTFPISSDFQTTTLTTYGGMIRWDGDGLVPDSYDPFSAVTASYSTTTGICTNCSLVAATSGRIVGDLTSAAQTISNPSSDGSAYKVSFKSITGSSACNVTLSVTDGNSVVWSIPISHSTWSTGHIALESGQSLTVAKLTSSGSCGKGIAVKFAKYQDITMEKSGFVKFASIKGATTTACTIKGRIMNPSGTYADDLYEYENFITAASSSSTADPLKSLSVPTNLSTATTLSWSSKVFVRKGQKIRFSPESWSSNWSAGSGLSRQCGVGMAMVITPRPALLCKGTASDTVLNPSCSADYDSSATLLGCQAVSSTCSNSTSSSYCPTSDCQKTVTCTANGTSSNNYMKTGCSLSSTTAGTCTYSGSITSTTCTNCSNAKLTAAGQAAQISVANMAQCYDLENYTGKVANILTTGYSTYSDTDLASTFDGLARIGSFNGDYGNLEGFADSGTTDSTTGNRIFTLKQPITFTQAGRLQFFMLDGSDLNGTSGAESAYTNNSAASTSYGGSNGFKLSLSGTLDFSNGQWMQARLCQESSNDDSNPSIDCKNSSPTKVTDQPNIIDITTPTSSTDTPVITSGYQFDSYGNILRTTSPISVVSSTGTTSYIDCTAAAHGVATVAGATFYCHTYSYYSDSELSSMSESSQETITHRIERLRLTFKILDPEVEDCNITTGATSGTLNGIKISNSLYQVSSSNTGAVCTATELAAGTCLKQYYCANKYSNNSGEYYVNVKVKATSSGKLSSIISGVIQPVIEVMDGPKTRDCSTTGSIISNDGVKTTNPDYSSATSSNIGATCSYSEWNSTTTTCTKQYYCKKTSVGQAERIYKLLIADTRYKAITTMCFVVMFTFYGVGYLMGTSELTHPEIINRIVKIGLIYLFVGEFGWEWFNSIVVRFFKNGTDYLAFMMASSFDSSPEVASAIANSDYYDKSVLFGSVDQVFNMFFSQAVQNKIGALFFASIFGWAYLMIIYNSFMLYVYSVANAVLLYLTAQVFISILFTLGPIFFIFTLFKQTEGMLNNWVSQLIGFSLQQIFLLTTLAFFNMLMYEVIKMSLGYKICWDEVWTINIITRITLLSYWTIASLPPRTNAQSNVGNIGNPDGIPSLFSILSIWVVASLMNRFIGFMTDLAATIGGGISASSLGGGLKAAAQGLEKMTNQARAKAWKATGGKLRDKIDDKLFDSGATADKRRADAKKKAANDKKNISALGKAGDKAVKEHQEKNALRLSGMSEADRKKELDDVRNKAVDKKADDLDLSASQRKALLEKKESRVSEYGKGGGDNLFKAAALGLMDYKKGNQSLQEKNEKAGTKMSHKTAEKAMKKMNKEERDEFINNISKEDGMAIGKSRMQKLREARGKAGAAAGKVGSATGVSDTWNAMREAGKKGNAAEATGHALGLVTGVEPAARMGGKALGAAATGVKAGLGATVTGAKAVVKNLKAVVGMEEGVVRDTGRAIRAQWKEGGKLGKTAAAARFVGSGFGIGEALARKAGKIGKQTASATGKAADKLAELAVGKEELEATRALEKEGSVSRLSGGKLAEVFLRTNAEKEAIKERTEANKKLAEKKSKLGASDTGTLTDLARSAEQKDREEEIDKDEDKGWFKKGASKVGVAFNHNIRSKGRKAVAQRVGEINRKSAKDGVKKELGETQKQLDTVKEARDSAFEAIEDARTELDDHLKSPETVQRNETIKDLNKDYEQAKQERKEAGWKKSLPFTEARKEAKEAEKKMKKAKNELAKLGPDSKATELENKVKTASATCHRFDEQIEILEKKVDTLETTEKEIEKAGTILDLSITEEMGELKEAPVDPNNPAATPAPIEPVFDNDNVGKIYESAKADKAKMSEAKKQLSQPPAPLPPGASLRQKFDRAMTKLTKKGDPLLKEMEKYDEFLNHRMTRARKAQGLNAKAQEIIERIDNEVGDDDGMDERLAEHPEHQLYERAQAVTQEYDGIQNPEGLQDFVEKYEAPQKEVTKLNKEEDYKEFNKRDFDSDE